jgi:uncharacterized protein VcgC/VcgE DUF2780
MRTNRCLAAAAVVLGAIAVLPAARVTAAQSKGAAAMSEAAQASPELVGALSKELGTTPDKAAGAGGALFGIAKSRLAPGDFSQVSKAVPGMDLLLKAAPSAGAVGTTGALSQLAGSAGPLAGAASAFSSLGLKPELVSKAVPVLVSFVSKSGGGDVGKLLAGALK